MTTAARHTTIHSSNGQYLLLLDEDFYAGLRSAALKAGVSDEDTAAYKASLRLAAFEETDPQREKSLQRVEELSHLTPYFTFGFTALCNYMRASDSSPAMKSLADYYMWRIVGRPALHRIRHGEPRPRY